MVCAGSFLSSWQLVEGKVSTGAGKSGSLFLRSADGKYILKTLIREEKDTLLRILPGLAKVRRFTPAFCFLPFTLLPFTFYPFTFCLCPRLFTPWLTALGGECGAEFVEPSVRVGSVCARESFRVLYGVIECV